MHHSKQKPLDFIPRFLAMTRFEQVSLCSFGLTKTFIFMHIFSPWQS